MSKVPKIDVSPAKRPRNGFDRSETHIYSQPAGMLLPVFQMFLNPNDHVSVDTSSIVQAQTLQGRPFLGMKQNFAFYFVPARLMCSYSKAFFSGVNPKNTVTSAKLVADNPAGSVLKVPTFKPYQVFVRFAGIPDETSQLLDVKWIESKFGGSAVKDPLAPGKNEGFSSGGYFGNRRAKSSGVDEFTEEEAKEAAAKPNPVFNVPGDAFFKKPYGDILAQNSNIVDALGYDMLSSYVRFCDMMKYGAMPYIGESVNIKSVTPELMKYEANLYYWLAYQKIYQDHFLDSNYEFVNPRSYNVDDLYDPTDSSFKFDFASTKEALDRAVDIFSPRYIKYEKDLLSNIHPSPLFLDDVSSTIKTFVGSAPVTGGSLDGRGKAFNPYKNSDTLVSTIWNGSAQSETIMSAAQLRNLMALDKMAQISSRAPKTYKGQMLAHYGVNVSDDLMESFYLGGFQKALEVSPVIATSDGKSDDGSTNFGQQGSYIDSAQSGHINFDAREHGVLMCLSWFSPSSLYDADGIDAFNTKMFREDYFVPEVEDLGMQPIEYARLLPPWIKFGAYRLPDMTGLSAEYLATHKKEVEDAYNATYKRASLRARGRTLGGESNAIDVSRVYGWQPRYHEFKAGADYIHGEFKTGRSMQVLTVHRPTVFNKELGLNVRSSFAYDNTYHGVPASFLYVDPACTNEVVEVNYDGTEKTDPFRITTHFAVSYISDMSVSGMPRV